MEEEIRVFSENTPKKQKKAALRFLVIEVIVLVLAVIAIFAVLNFTGIFPIERILNNLTEAGSENEEVIFNSQPTGVALNPDDPIITTGPTIDPEEVNGEIEVISDVPGYEITLSNSVELLNLFKTLGIYEKIYSTPEGSTEDVPLERIVIHLVDDKEGVTRRYQDLIGYDTLFEEGIVISKGKFDLSVYVDPALLSSDIELSEDFLLATSIAAIYSRSKNLGDELSIGERREIVAEINRLKAINPFEITKLN